VRWLGTREDPRGQVRDDRVRMRAPAAGPSVRGPNGGARAGRPRQFRIARITLGLSDRCDHPAACRTSGTHEDFGREHPADEIRPGQAALPQREELSAGHRRRRQGGGLTWATNRAPVRIDGPPRGGESRGVLPGPACLGSHLWRSRSSQDGSTERTNRSGQDDIGVDSRSIPSVPRIARWTPWDRDLHHAALSPGHRVV